MNGYKGRAVESGKKSQVYFNLHKKCFSMKQGGLVVLHAEAIVLTGATFHVNEAGRQRVLQEKRKNVHAYVKGDFVPTNLLHSLESFKRDMKEAHYNPYEAGSFVDKETRKPLTSSAFVVLEGKKIFYK